MSIRAAAYIAEELETAIAAAGLQKNVKLVGHCDDMPAAYLLADFACAPSLDPEPFGRTWSSCRSAALLVLAADHGAARETAGLGETGWLVSAHGDPDAWARALKEGDRDFRRIAARRNGPRRARRGARALYSVDAMCVSTLDVYRRVLEAHR